MKLDQVRKQYNDGLLTRDEAIMVIEAIGKSAEFAARYLDGFNEIDIPFVLGASRKSVLVFNGTR